MKNPGWERGTNENTNGLLREYFPKGTEITDDQPYLDTVARELNNRPRRILGYRPRAARGCNNICLHGRRRGRLIGKQERSYKFAFLLDERLLRDCVRLVADSIHLIRGPVSGSPPTPIGYLVEFSDDSLVRLDSIEAVLQLPNDTTARIQRISVSTDLSYAPHVTIEFRSVFDSFNYSYHILEHDEPQVPLAKQLDRFGRRIKCWYTWVKFGRAPKYSFVIVAFLAGVIGYPILAVLFRSIKGTLQSDAAAYAVLSGTVVLVGATILLLSRFGDWLFPAGLFVIGDGIVLLERLRFWRSLIGSGVLLAATVNIATAFFV